MRLDLSVLRRTTPARFTQTLDRWTKELMRKMPRIEQNGYNWGAARKALNLFMIQAFMNKYLAKKYNMAKFEHVLETPLDSQARDYLWRKSSKNKLCKFNTIKRMKPQHSACYQKVTSDVAEKRGIPRACLDILIWRQDTKNKKKNHRKK